MDSESSTESEDYSHDESDDEYQDEDNSDLEDEFTTSFEELSTVPRNWKKGSFKPYLFSFDSSDCGLSSTLTNLFLETAHLTSLNYFLIRIWLKRLSKKQIDFTQTL